MRITLDDKELGLIITALEYAVDYYDGETSLGDMSDLQERLELKRAQKTLDRISEPLTIDK